MNDGDFTTAFTVDQSPEEVFAANIVRAWWSGEIDGVTDELGAQLTYRYKDVHRSAQTIIVLGGSPNFVKDTHEWDGTTVARRGGKTELRFTHKGLVPAIECYGGCSGAWASTWTRPCLA
jgi:hypothetical protein